MNRTNADYAPSDLHPYPRNARVHSDEQVQQIAESIERFGFTRPLLIDESLTVLAGHGALEAALKLELDSVPVVQIGGLSEDEKRAYVLIDNKLALNSFWDDALLRAEVNDLVSLDLGDILGFDANEIAILNLEKLWGENDPNAEWIGMPDYTNSDKRGFRTILLHFKDQESVDQFAELIGQSFTDKAKYLWFPEIEIESRVSHEWTDADAS